MKRLVRRLTLSSVLARSGLEHWFLLSTCSAHKSPVCGVPLMQPQISDSCGALGLGNRPTKTELVAWESRERGSCAALRTHVERFPQGAYRADAADMLAARRVTQKETWTSSTRKLSLYVSQDEAASSNEAAAHAAALSSWPGFCGALVQGLCGDDIVPFHFGQAGRADLELLADCQRRGMRLRRRSRVRA